MKKQTGRGGFLGERVGVSEGEERGSISNQRYQRSQQGKTTWEMCGTAVQPGGQHGVCMAGQGKRWRKHDSYTRYLRPCTMHWHPIARERGTRGESSGSRQEKCPNGRRKWGDGTERPEAGRREGGKRRCGVASTYFSSDSYIINKEPFRGAGRYSIQPPGTFKK